ncbi:hypothetical protein NMY22_g14886 [Coprinellus aureogranulatus]|nr:hypothetical protein NMY22_g14886 [Coprinellus aureogranulatus]
MSFLFRKIVALASPANISGHSKERRTPAKSPIQRATHPPPYSPPPPYHVAPDASPPSLLLAPVYEESPASITPPKTPKMMPRELDWSPVMEKTEKLWEEKLTAETQQYKDLHTPSHSPVPAISPWIAPLQSSRDTGYQARRPSFSDSSSSISSLESVGPWASTTSLTSSPPPPCLTKSGPLGSVPRPGKSKCRVSFENPAKPQTTYMHPLFAWTETRPNAPIFYDVSTPPPTPGPATPTEEMKDFLDQPIPLCTLLEPATEPPFCPQRYPRPSPEDIRRRRSSSSSSTRRPSNLRPGGLAGKKKFFIDHESAFSSDTEDEDDDVPYPRRRSSVPERDAVITNLDVLRSIHSSLSLPISQADWTQLSEDDQKEVSKAYRKRCRGAQERGTESPRPGGVWAEGVKRVDFLKGKSVVVGIEASDSVARKQSRTSRAKGAVGRIVFAKGKKRDES